MARYELTLIRQPDDERTSLLEFESLFQATRQAEHHPGRSWEIRDHAVGDCVIRRHAIAGDVISR